MTEQEYGDIFVDYVIKRFASEKKYIYERIASTTSIDELAKKIVYFCYKLGWDVYCTVENAFETETGQLCSYLLTVKEVTRLSRRCAEKIVNEKKAKVTND